jgi:hypothetical protein
MKVHACCSTCSSRSCGPLVQLFSGHGGVGELGLVCQMNQENGQGPARKAMWKRHGCLRACDTWVRSSSINSMKMMATSTSTTA